MCSNCDFIEIEYENGAQWIVHYKKEIINKMEVFFEFYREKGQSFEKNELFI